MLTTVQDLGRTGYQSQGFSVAGVMDVRSFKIANLLVDNPENEPVLEFTLIGPTLEFTSDTIIAITGGDFNPTINGEPAPMYTAIYMHKGDILKFGSAVTGSRGYISFSSYLKVPTVMVMGPTDANRNGPYGQLQNAIEVDRPCRWCWKRACPKGLDCLERITPDMVKEKISAAIGI